MTGRRVLVMLAIWVVLVVSLWASDSQPAVVVLGGIVAVAGAAFLAALDLGSSMSRVQWTRQPRRPATTNSGDPRVSALRHQAYGAWWSGSTQISDTLVALVDDRLQAHHHIDRASDPASAGAVLTPTLRRLVAGPRRQTATVRELGQILTDIEAL